MRVFKLFLLVSIFGIDCFSQSPNITAYATGKSTGIIGYLHFENTTEEAINASIGPYVIPEGPNSQGFIIPDACLKYLEPGEAEIIPLEGYCTDNHRPVPPIATQLPNVNSWITKSEFKEEWISELADSKAPSFLKKIKKEQNLLAKIPEFDLPFNYEMNIQDKLEFAAPLIKQITTELQSQVDSWIDSNQDKFFAEIDQLDDIGIQNCLWVTMGLLNGKPFTFSDFKGNIMEQDVAVNSLQNDLEKQELFENQIAELWNQLNQLAESAAAIDGFQEETTSQSETQSPTSTPPSSSTNSIWEEIQLIGTDSKLKPTPSKGKLKWVIPAIGIPLAGGITGIILAGGDEDSPGCTDPNSCNFNPDATTDDGTCVYEQSCDDNICSNGGIFVWSSATCSCELIEASIFGCTDFNACNYNPEANCEDGSCIEPDCSGDCIGGTPGPALPGTSCDDGNPDTIEDIWSEDCECEGVFPNDCEGVAGGGALPGTSCDDGNPDTIEDTWSEDCNCAGVFPNDCEGVAGGGALPGTSCDDGNPDTIEDTWSEDCNCAGVFPNDCEGVAGGGALPGTSCDDGNPDTIEDTWSEDCNCEGVLPDDCEGVAGGVAGGGALPGTSCDDGNPDTIEDTWSEDCECAGVFPNDCEGVAGGGALPGTSCDDGNPDTIEDTWSEDCNCEGVLLDDCEGVAGGAALPGTSCDDGNPDTIEDTWSEDCNCAGVLPDDCEGVAGGGALPGTSCDDGNPDTIEDTWSEDCECAGVFPNDCEGVAGGGALPGTSCDDGNPDTIEDTWSEDCECEGVFPNDCEGVAGGGALPGTSCDDGNPDTIEDTWSEDCSCEGVFPDDCEGVAGGGALPGTSCDDGNPDTIEDTWSEDCNCEGVLPDDCEGVAGGGALPGTSCDDGNPDTIEDTWSEDCECAGVFPNDCEGVAGGGALPGTSCDDGNPDTIEDTWSEDCECAGVFPNDCEGVAGGGALPGTSCDDGNPDTIEDTWSEDCACEGILPNNCGGILTQPGLPCFDIINGAGIFDENCNCIFDEIFGCTDSTACNFNPNATIDDGSCLELDCLGECVEDSPYLPGLPCEFEGVVVGTYNEDCICVVDEIFFGCTDSTACNYDPDANMDDNSCIMPDCEGACDGQLSGPAQPGNECFTAEGIQGFYDVNCNCIFENIQFGCTNQLACNYDPNANAEDNSCILPDCNGICEGQLSGPAQPGTPCNDNNEETFDDTYNANCECIGIPCEFCISEDPCFVSNCELGHCITTETPLVANDDILGIELSSSTETFDVYPLVNDIGTITGFDVVTYINEIISFGEDFFTFQLQDPIDNLLFTIEYYIINDCEQTDTATIILDIGITGSKLPKNNRSSELIQMGYNYNPIGINGLIIEKYFGKNWLLRAELERFNERNGLPELPGPDLYYSYTFRPELNYDPFITNTYFGLGTSVGRQAVLYISLRQNIFLAKKNRLQFYFNHSLKPQINNRRNTNIGLQYYSTF